ncbi:hypothetical protein PVK06_041747 [Gossypium arboreum]|uniref:UVR domain-containing protein n=1 Tax=Gossypium arboreum TaxID=29729 RepID=A0ABR0N943_GOSAR|nr:hypothetical protein PVK06_041747 [Gossypium arboreum]
MPFGIDKLINLQRLSDFIIGEGDGHHIRVLKYFSNLKGDFRFSGLENVNCQDAREAKVNEKQGIDRLVLHWSKNFYKDSRNKEHEEWVLGSLCPPKKLEQLVIKNYGGAKFSTWIADSSFKNMLSLGLRNYLGVQEFAIFFGFTCFLNDRFPPDKAIDLIDEAGSRVRLRHAQLPEEAKDLEKELWQLTKSKNEAVRDQDLKKAGGLRDREITLRAQITAVQEKDKGMNKGVEGSLVVTEADIQHIVSSWTGIPVEKVSTDEFDRLLKMEETLHKRVVGQDEAVKAINRAIRRARVGLKNPRPIASFIYSGPTGVGNSELAKNLQYLIDEKENNNTINNVCLLEHLDISDCHSLIWLSSTDISFPEEGFPTNLTSLKVSKEPRIYTSLVEWGFNRLTSLPELIISGEGCPNVVSFPEEGIVITLPPLTFIFIQKFENLEYMWFMGFQHLTSLQQLQIYTCPKLTSLPEKDMLLSLEHLLIYNCPLLEEGCSRGKGREWSKVAHIPYVQIDVPTVISRGLD